MGKTKRIIAAVMAALMTMSSSALIPANAVDETVNVSLQSVSENESKEYAFNEINAMTTEDVVNLFTEKGLNKDNGYKVYGLGNDAEYVYCFSWNVYLFSEDFLSNRTVEEILTDYAPPQDGDCLYDKGESLWDTDRIVSALALPEEYFEITVFKTRVFVKEADSTDKNKIACNCEIRCKLPEGEKRAAMRNAALNYLQLRKDFDKLLIDDAVPYYGKEKTVAQKYGEAIADYMANNDIQGVVSRSVPDEKLSIGFHGDHEEQLMAYITEIGLDESGIPYELEKLPDFIGFNDLIVTTAPQPTATTIAVTGSQPVTTITMPVVDDPTIQTEVVTVTVMDVSSDNILVKPVDGSPELNSSDKFYLSSKKISDDIKPKVGMKLEITYNGGILETYPAQFRNVQKVVEVKDDTVKEDPTLLKGTKDMILNDVMRLAELGDELDWADFRDYNGKDVGSGQYIWEYKLEDGYVLRVIGVTDKKPDYILLSHDNDKGIDIRTNDVKEYIASTATPVVDDPSIMTSDYTMTVTVIEINGSSLLVKNIENHGDVLTLPANKLDNGIKPVVGMKLEVTYNDGILETYPGQFGNIQKVTVLSETTEIVAGDANCDGQLDLSDAVMIMQALANPNKYGINGTAEHHLTEQGKLNGDMDGDGLTVGDAQAIQLKLLGIVDSKTNSYLKDIVSIRTPYDPIMSNWSGIGILLEFDSPEYQITLFAEDGHFTNWDINKGSGPIKDMGTTYEVGKNGYIFWTPDDFNYPEDFETEIIVKGTSSNKSVELGRIYVTSGERSTLTASLEKPDSAIDPMQPEIVTIKSDYNPIMSDISGIGILLEIDSKEYPITLKTNKGYFKIDDIEKGGGVFKIIGQKYEIGNSGRVFWYTDEVEFDADYQNEIVIIGEKDGKSKKIGNIVITPSNSHTLTAVLK